jgi:hypothetical protein
MPLKRMGLLSISAVLFIIAIIVYMERAVIAANTYGASDFFRVYQSVLFYFSGQDLYGPIIVKRGLMDYVKVTANLNAPFLMLLVLPLHIFNYAKAFVIWNVVSVVCMVLGAILAIRIFPQWRKNTLPILVLFLVFFPNLASLIYGENSLLLFLIVTGAWVLARKNKDIPAGVLIGLACALKLFCGLFLIYFLCVKRYRLVWISVLTLMGTVLVGGCFFGLHAYSAFHSSLNSIFWYADTWNVSFYGFFMRIFSGAEQNAPLVMAPSFVPILTAICSLGLLTVLVWKWRQWGEQQFDRGFSLVIVSMLLLSPLGWIYYFPLLFIPYLVIVSEENDSVHLVVCGLLLLSTRMPHLVYSALIQTPLQIFWAGGVGFYVLLGLFVLLSQTYPKKRWLSPRWWGWIYVGIFAPALSLLLLSFVGFTFLHHA